VHRAGGTIRLGLGFTDLNLVLIIQIFIHTSLNPFPETRLRRGYY